MQLAAIVEADYVTIPTEDTAVAEIQNEEQLKAALAQLETQMREAAKKFEFERAATIRDHIRLLKQRDLGVGPLFESAPAPAAATPADAPVPAAAPAETSSSATEAPPRTETAKP
jgi:hypothetical protein